jgi:DNA-binding protein HU-beta
MTKKEFVDAVAARTGLTKRDAGAAVDAALDVIESTLRNGDSITFTGFGKFHVSRRASRQGVNPRTGEKVVIAAANVPKFSAGSSLKSAVKVSETGGSGSSRTPHRDESRAPAPSAEAEGEPDEPWREEVDADSEGEPDEPWRPGPRPR